MSVCKICGKRSIVISESIGVCVECLRTRGREALAIAMKSHREYRTLIGLPPEPPRDENGVKCNICVNNCSIPPKGIGYCGYWRNSGGRLEPVEGFGKSVMHMYLDPHPTNCVATPICPAYRGTGYPKFAITPGTEYGYYNLAIFFAGCNLDCLFCQNWEHKDIIVSAGYRRRYTVSNDYVVKYALMNDRVTCICFFGGDPGPQIVNALYISRKVVEHVVKEGIVKRICWETNGLVNPDIMKEIAKASLVSGGIVKIDWKCWTPSLYQALTGVDGDKALDTVKRNVKIVAEMGKERPEIPLLVVSILLVPGYVDAEEVYKISRYLAEIDSRIPLVLLAFHPDHLLRDLPTTSRRHVNEAYRAAREAGLENIYIGNEWLLSNAY